MTRLLLDASAIVEWERGNPAAVSLIESEEEIFTSPVAAFEVISGLSEKKRLKTMEFFKNYPPEAFDIDDAYIAAEITGKLKKAGKMINSLDIMIAAQAARLGLTVLAKDEHFDTISSVYPAVSVVQIQNI